MDEQGIDTRNDFLMAAKGNQIGPLIPVVMSTRQQAYRTAAWIKVMADMLPEEGEPVSFEEIESAIRNT